MMPEHRQHGRPYQEPERHDELSDGVAAERSRAEKRSTQRFQRGSTAAKAAGSLGGSSHKGRTKLSHAIEGAKLSETSRRRARVLRKALSTEIAATVGGGHCGIAASLFIKFASQKTAAAEEAFERGDYEAHRKLSESARMDVLYAREHAAKEAQSRPRRSVDLLAKWNLPEAST